ncbi:transcriptional regulator [Enterobacter bugandensis]
MNSDVLLVVLTEDSWLFAGLAALLPEVVCRQSGFFAHRLPWEVKGVRRIIIAVDSRIVFRGEWSALTMLQARRPDATVVWLTRKETGRVFPSGSCGDRILNQQQDIFSLRNALRRGVQRPESLWGEECVTATGLTLTERRLLPFFLSGVSVPLLSKLTGKPLKTLYSHRHKILSKTGFRQLAFLQFVYERNRGLPGFPGLAPPDEKPQHEESKACTV